MLCCACVTRAAQMGVPALALRQVHDKDAVCACPSSGRRHAVQGTPAPPLRPSTSCACHAHCARIHDAQGLVSRHGHAASPAGAATRHPQAVRLHHQCLHPIRGRSETRKGSWLAGADAAPPRNVDFRCTLAQSCVGYGLGVT